MQARLGEAIFVHELLESASCHRATRLQTPGCYKLVFSTSDNPSGFLLTMISISEVFLEYFANRKQDPLNNPFPVFWKSL